MNVSGNKGLTTLNVTNNTALTNLNISNTGIAILDLTANAALIDLNLSGSKITSFAGVGLEKNVALKNLDLSNTAYTGLDLSGNLNLEKLNIANTTAIKNPDLKNSINLKTLDASDSTLTALDLTANKALTNLNVSKTTLPTLDLSKNTSLATLNTSDNTALTNLNVSGTALTSLDVSTNSALIDLNVSKLALPTLDLSKNKNLTTLNTSDNTALTELNVSGTALKILDLSTNNRLETLNTSNITALTYLNVSGTSLMKLDVATNTALTSIKAINSKLPALNVASNVALTNLNIDGTRIETLDVTKNTKLVTLALNNTFVSMIDLSKNPDLTSLTAIDTELTSLDLTANTKLINVDATKSPVAFVKLPPKSTITNLKLDETTPKDVTVYKTKGEYNIKTAFPDIDLAKISDVKDGTINSTTGVITPTVENTTVSYTYDCGMNGASPIVLHVNVTVATRESTISIIGELNKSYDGNPVKDPECATTGTGAVTYKYEVQDAEAAGSYRELDSAPKDAGNYRVTATIAADGDYKAAVSLSVYFEIEPAINVWTFDWAKDFTPEITYGSPLNLPTTVSKFGQVTYTYSKSMFSAFTSVQPTDAGDYFLQVTVSGIPMRRENITTNTETDTNYTELETVVPFTILPGINSWTKALTMPNWEEGQMPSLPTATSKYGTVTYTYSNAMDGTFTSEVPTTVGTWYVKATVAGTDNYDGLVSDPVSFTIASKAGIPANPINPSNPGDPGATTNIGAMTNKGTIINADSKTMTGVVNTGDTTRTGFFALLGVLSAGCIAFITGKKRSKAKK